VMKDLGMKNTFGKEIHEEPSVIQNRKKKDKNESQSN
jgi:hypothetical protein